MLFNKKIAAAVAALLVSGVAVAGPYVVGSVGVASWDVDCEGAANCDKTDVGFKLLGGYKFASNLAVEAGYFNFGKARISDSGLSADFKAVAFGAGLAVHTDISPQWNAVARLGVASVRTTLDASLAGYGSASDEQSSTQAYAGLGVGYLLTPALSLDAALDFTNAKFEGEKGNISKFSLGLTYSF